MPTSVAPPERPAGRHPPDAAPGRGDRSRVSQRLRCEAGDHPASRPGAILGLLLLTAFVLWIASLAVRRMQINYGTES